MKACLTNKQKGKSPKSVLNFKQNGLVAAAKSVGLSTKIVGELREIRRLQKASGKTFVIKLKGQSCALTADLFYFEGVHHRAHREHGENESTDFHDFEIYINRL